MSIAISAVVQPSKMLFGLCTAFCCGCMLLGLAFLLGAVPAIPLLLAGVLGLFCFFCAGFGLRSLRRSRQIWQLDISGTGQIRLSRKLPDAGKDISHEEKSSGGSGLLVRLLADSTMWPNFLLLRLCDEEGRMHHVAILPDSLPSESFRAVSVACRWIAAHRFAE
jgi:hypothetical protein